MRDNFTTARAAGAVNGTLAEPGPGTRRATDTAGTALDITVLLGLTLATAENAFRDPDLYYTPAAPIGAALFVTHHSGSAADGPYYVISPTDRPANPSATGLGIGVYGLGVTEYLRAYPSNAVISKPETLLGDYYYLYLIRRPGGGGLYIANGGIYSNDLLWVADTDDFVSDTYLGIDDKAGTCRTVKIEALPPQ